MGVCVCVCLSSVFIMCHCRDELLLCFWRLGDWCALCCCCFFIICLASQCIILMIMIMMTMMIGIRMLSQGVLVLFFCHLFCWHVDDGLGSIVERTSYHYCVYMTRLICLCYWSGDVFSLVYFQMLLSVLFLIIYHCLLIKIHKWCFTTSYLASWFN